MISAKEIIEGAIKLHELAQWVHYERRDEEDPFAWRLACGVYARAGRAALLGIARHARLLVEGEAVDIERLHTMLVGAGWLSLALSDIEAARLLTQTLLSDRCDLDPAGWIAASTERSALVLHADAAHALLEAACGVVFNTSLDQILRTRP